MERNDDTGLPAETGQTADTGQVNDMGPPDDTGQSDDMALSAYDPSVEWSNSAGLPDDGEPYYGSDPPDDTGQANSTGQASSTGETENEILEDAVIDVIALLKPTDTPEQVARDVTKKMEDRIGLKNISRAKGDKIKNPKKLRPFQIAMLILAMFHVRRVPCAGPGASRKYDLLVIYMEHGSDAGTYVEHEEEFYRIARRFNPQITSGEFEEVLSRLRTDAKRVTRTMDPDLIAVNNGIFNFKTRELLPFSPDYVFLTKSHVDYNQDATNVVIHNDEDGTDWDVESWIESLSDDPEIVDLLWELLSAIVRPYVTWNKSIWFYSTVGNNGKGTFCVLLRNLCGEGAVATIPISDFAVKFALEVLVKAMAIVTDENDVGAYIDKVANLKAIITGDAVSIDRKFLTPISFQFHGLMVQCVNEMPRIKDKSGSFYRRLLIVPFDKCFTGKEREYIKGDYLKRSEVLEYVLYRALNMDFYKFSNPHVCKSLLNEYTEYNDPVQEFFQEFFLEREEADEAEEGFVWDLLPFDFLYDLYRAWFAKNNPHGIPQSKKTFTDDIVSATKQSNIWICENKRKTVRSNGRMDKPEPLIIQYDLKDWMNPTYTGSNNDMIARPALKLTYRGLQRRDNISRTSCED